MHWKWLPVFSHKIWRSARSLRFFFQKEAFSFQFLIAHCCKFNSRVLYNFTFAWGMGEYGHSEYLPLIGCSLTDTWESDWLLAEYVASAEYMSSGILYWEYSWWETQLSNSCISIAIYFVICCKIVMLSKSSDMFCLSLVPELTLHWLGDNWSTDLRAVPVNISVKLLSVIF